MKITSSTVRARRPPRELLSQWPDTLLVSALEGTESARSLTSFEDLEIAAARAGITRVGQIAGFLDGGIEVAQTARPNLWDHAATGMNTGSQGKGATLEGAMIGAIMEALEAYCSEPRNPNLIRGSYNSLKQTHAVLSPEHLVQAKPEVQISNDDELMWTSCLAWPLNERVWLPAELIYCIFHQSSYGCRAGFSCNSSGTAGGFTFTDAMMRALLEFIERHYTYYLERNEVRVEALKIEGPIEAMMLKHSTDFLTEYSIQLYSIEAPQFGSNLPFVYCEIGNEESYGVGYGLSLSPAVAIERAYTEAFQGLVTTASGARDDLSETSDPFIDDERANWPTHRTLSYRAFAGRFENSAKFATTSKASLGFLTSWVQSLGYPLICFSNLTREGIDVPVVKTYVPGMILCDRYRTEAPGGWTFERVMRHRFFMGAQT